MSSRQSPGALLMTNSVSQGGTAVWPKVGDLVKVKGFHQKMIVLGFHPSRSYTCFWFDGAVSYEHDFPKEALESAQ